MKKVEIRDVLKYRFPENLQYNPDGTLLAFQAAYADEEKNTYRRDVHLIREGKDTQLTASLDASIVVWDDNETLILKRNTPDTKPGVTALYKINVNGGEALPWIELPFVMTGMDKVKDGVYAVLGMIDADDPDAYKDTPTVRAAKMEEKKAEKDYQVVDEVPYWFNGAGFTNKKRTALFIVTAEPLKMKRITAPLFDCGSTWVEGETVYYTGNKRDRKPELSSRLYAYHTDTGKKETLYGKNDRSIDEVFVFNKKLVVAETDGKEFGVNETRGFSYVDDGTVKRIMKPDVSLHNGVAVDMLLGGGHAHAVLKDKYITIATVEDHTTIRCYDKKFKFKTLFDKGGNIPFLDAKGDKIAFGYMDWNHLAEIYEMDLNGENVRCLTSLNTETLQDTYIAEPKEIEYTSAGYDLKGWVLLPQNFDSKKKYPAVLDIHGGPRGVYSTAFFHEMQVWASKGYVVFFTNIKGSDGRGDEFADIRDQYGYVDYQNLMDFTDAVLAKYPNIDTKKICETGGSYGGFMTNWIITQTDRFCCTASQRSISNWVSMSFISDIGLYFGPDQCGAKGLFGDINTEKLWNHSPLKYADNVKTPTLFIHSDEDYRCPLPEGMQMMQALAVRNVETRMVIFHGENHELSRSGKPLHRIRRLQEITDWFDIHTK